MDNASKALIMAGAILIAVALVGMGVYLVSIISNPADSAVTLIDTQDVLTKNRQIEQYCGTSVKGSEVRTLLRTLETMNARDYFPDDIVPTGAVTDTDAASVNSINASARYTVTVTYDTDGFVDSVNIVKNS